MEQLFLMCVENEFAVRGSIRGDRAEEFGGPIPTYGFGGGVTVNKLFSPSVPVCHDQVGLMIFPS